MISRRCSAALAALALACSYGERAPSPEGDGRATPEATQDTPRAEPAAPERTAAQIRSEGNHLLGEPSPYLEQHAHNPVDWYPWGDEALAKAKREGKPIFLSIGYATCHWCHVMEKESFEDDEVATYLNTHFVSIKVDREHRPDIDAIYLDAVAALGGSTGWPLTVFLTPDLEPFFGGTYFPRHAQAGRPGFLDVCKEVHGSFTADPAAAGTSGRAALERIEKEALAAHRRPIGLGVQVLDDAIGTLASGRDTVAGGFGRRQKFPNPPLLLAELRHHVRTGNAESRDHLVLTLEEMMRGGIRDHVSGGFHRYTVDARWHVPHFEKTLYDNAQLAALYIEAGRTLGRDDFVAVGRAVLDELLAAWQEADGGFVVGFDADDPKGEGVYYTWTPAELEEALGAEDAALVGAAFGVTEAGERELHGRSVLHRRPDAEVAREKGVAASAVGEAIARALPQMAKARGARPAPRRDDKELAGWTALAVIALADAGRWLDEPRYVEAARRAGTFLVKTCHTGDRMLRGVRAGKSLGDGVLEDHALTGLALVRLHAATGDPEWLVHAAAIEAELVARFHDAERHAFLRTAADAPGVPVRMPDLEDGVMPSGGAAAVLLELELGALAGDPAMRRRGLDVLERMVGTIVARPFGAGFLLVAVDHASAPVREVVIAGEAADPDTNALWNVVRGSTHARVLSVRVPADGATPALSASFPALQGKKARGGRPTAYVCEEGRCELPTSDGSTLRRQLAAALSADAVRPG
jgi:uncharacterized protein YyaL (SSP411 family)